MTNKHNQLMAPLLVFIMLFMVNGSGNVSNGSVERISDDVWSEIMGNLNGLDLKRLLFTDSKRQKLVNPVWRQRKCENEREIKMVIEELQNSAFNEINKNSPNSAFNASSNDLMKQYFSGFDGELEFISTHSQFDTDDAVVILLQEQISKLVQLLNDYKTNYGPFKPIHRMKAVNISDDDMVKFDKFHSMYLKMEHFISIIEKMAGENNVTIQGDSIVLKISLQCIGLKIGYPSIGNTHFLLGTGMRIYQDLLEEYTKGFVSCARELPKIQTPEIAEVIGRLNDFSTELLTELLSLLF